MSSSNKKRNTSEALEQSMPVDDIELAEIGTAKAGTGSSLLRGNMDVIKNVRVRLDVIVGEAELAVSDLFALTRDSVVSLDKDISSPVDIMLDGRVVARGSLVAVGDNFGVRITDITGS